VQSVVEFLQSRVHHMPLLICGGLGLKQGSLDFAG
jgi:hypothetical protein